MTYHVAKSFLLLITVFRWNVVVLSLIAGLLLLGCGGDAAENKQVTTAELDLNVEQKVCELKSGDNVWNENGKTSEDRCQQRLKTAACAKTPNTPYLIESTGACATKAQYDQALAESICEKAQQEYDQATGACRSGVSGARKSRVAKAKAHCKKKTDGSKWNAGTKKCDPAPAPAAAANAGADAPAAAFSVTYDAGVFTFANVGTDLSLGAGEKTVDVFLNTETTATVSLTLGLDDDKTGVTLSAADADKDKLKEAVNGLADAAAKNAFTLKLQLKADGTNVEATVEGSSVTLENADAKVLAEKAGADLSGDGVNAAATDLTKLKEAVKGLVDAAA